MLTGKITKTNAVKTINGGQSWAWLPAPSCPPSASLAMLVSAAAAVQGWPVP